MKNQKHQIVQSTFEINLLDNPRRSPTEMGAQTCHLCGGRSSVLVQIIMAHYEEGPPHVVMCKGCLDKLDKLINYGILKGVKDV